MTLDCLHSVARETMAEHEVIVVDNASTDGSAEAIADIFPETRLIASKENLGFGPANNLAGTHARGRYVLLLNPDTLILDKAIDRLLAVARRSPAAQMWGGRTVFADNSPNRTNCYQDVTVWRLFCRATGLAAISGNHRFFSTAYGGWDMADEREVDILTGCFLLLTRDLWNGLGGFDPAFFLFDEETDLCLRARRDFGARPRYTPEAVIVHHGSASLPRQADRIIHQLKGRLLLVDRHFQGLRRRLARVLVWAMPANRALAERVSAALRGSKAGEGKWTEIWRRRKEWGRSDPAFR
jgi:hypothetical protein